MFQKYKKVKKICPQKWQSLWFADRTFFWGGGGDTTVGTGLVLVIDISVIVTQNLWSIFLWATLIQRNARANFPNDHCKWNILTRVQMIIVSTTSELSFLVIGLSVFSILFHPAILGFLIYFTVLRSFFRSTSVTAVLLGSRALKNRATNINHTFYLNF